VRPESVEGDWNRLYSEFPEVYEAFASYPHDPEPIDVIAARVPLDGVTVVDVGAGTGKSTFELATRATQAIGVEPNPAMRALAEQRAAAAGTANVSFVAGSASALPLPDGSTDVLAAVTTSFWPAEQVVPDFLAEVRRVLRPAGTVFVLGIHPDWYGGELREFVRGAPEYERTLNGLLEDAGFAQFDFETVQDYRTTANAIGTYGFIFGSRAIEELRRRRQTRICWRWRLHTLTPSG
jgi:ubiquinone/menaquinone biosynthesis C-methylase UbiE